MSDTEMPRHMQFVSLDNTFKELNDTYSFKQSDYKTGGPSNYYTSEKLKIKIGFITPLSNNFCATCNRVRISSTGKMYMCLGQNDNANLKKVLREQGIRELKKELFSAISRKPKGHDFNISKNSKNIAVGRHMSLTGG